jgi:hypothetical protein
VEKVVALFFLLLFPIYPGGAEAFPDEAKG